MSERAGLFEQQDDFDVSGFTPKVPNLQPAFTTPSADVVRAVSESNNFRSREPVAVPAKTRQTQRRHRTGRNLQLNLKVAAETYEAFYKIADSHGWVLGETLEKAVAALKRDLEKEEAAKR